MQCQDTMSSQVEYTDVYKAADDVRLLRYVIQCAQIIAKHTPKFILTA